MAIDCLRASLRDCSSLRILLELISRCSAGIGRTGAFIVLDYLLSVIKFKGQFHVFINHTHWSQAISNIMDVEHKKPMWPYGLMCNCKCMVPLQENCFNKVLLNSLFNTLIEKITVNQLRIRGMEGGRSSLLHIARRCLPE